jgi:hypothetical protein
MYRIGLPTFSIDLSVGLRMRWSLPEAPFTKLVLTTAVFVAFTPEARAAAPLYDPVILNIGVNCQWQQRCEHQQRSAMKNAHRYIAHEHPPLWRIRLCNRNARRATARIDWIGFEDCIRNSSLKPMAQRRR